MLLSAAFGQAMVFKTDYACKDYRNNKKRERIITFDGILFSWEEKGDFRYSKPVNLPDGLTGISAIIIRNIWEPVVRGERELVNTYRAEVILMPPVGVVVAWETEADLGGLEPETGYDILLLQGRRNRVLTYCAQEGRRIKVVHTERWPEKIHRLITLRFRRDHYLEINTMDDPDRPELTASDRLTNDELFYYPYATVGQLPYISRFPPSSDRLITPPELIILLDRKFPDPGSQKLGYHRRGRVADNPLLAS